MVLRKKYGNGFILIEVVVVISIVTILSMMIVSVCAEYINKARKRVCEANYLQIERMYDVHLKLENREYSDVKFNNFLLQYGGVIYPDEGHMIYIDGKVLCEVHQGDEEKEDADSEVPFL